MEPQELIDAIAEARANGYSDAEISDYLAKQGAPPEVLQHIMAQGQPQAGGDMGGYVKQDDGSLMKQQAPQAGYGDAAMAGLVQGGTLGWGDEMGLQDPAMLAASKKAHPIVTGISQIVGSLPYLAIPGAAASPIISGTVMGAAQGAGEAQGGLQERAMGAGTGAVVGGTVGGVAKAAPAIMDFLAPFVPGSIKRAVVRAAGRIIPVEDAAATMARMGQLAPGSETMAAVDEGYAQLAGVASRSEEGGRKAVAALAGKQQALQRGREALGGLYEAADKVMIPITPEVRSILAKSGRLVQASDTEVEAGVLRNLRDSYKTRMMDPMTGKQTSRAMRDAAKANDEITAVLEQHAPDISKIDADYAFLSERLRNISEGIQAVRDAASSMARQQAAGTAVASPRGSLGMGPGGPFARLTEGLMGTNPNAAGNAVAGQMAEGAVPQAAGQSAADFMRANGAALPWMAGNPLAQFILNQKPNAPPAQ